MEFVLMLGIMGMATGALSMTVTKAKVTARLRAWVGRRSKWAGELVTCPYCFSHWGAFGLTLWSGVAETLFDVVVMTFAVVAFAAATCGVIYRGIAEIPAAEETEAEGPRRVA